MSVYSLTDLKKAIYCLLKNRYVYISYTNGVGNNIFQYNFCYSLICKKNNIKIINPFFINKSMNNIFNRIISRFIVNIHQLLKGFLPLISIIDNKTKCVPNSKIIFFGDTGEVLSAYEGKEDIIKENFFKLNKSFLNSKKYKKNIKKIVIHFRLGDRLFYKTDYQKGMYYDLEKLQNILDHETKINNNKVSIFAVTDSPNIFEIRNIKTV